MEEFKVIEMKTDDFDYYLDESLIAQTPLKKRDASRLMLVDKKSGFYKHEKFTNIINYLKPGDVLVLNNTRVIPARIIGVKEKTGAVIELLLLKDLEDSYECLVKPARRIKEGDIVSFGDGLLKAECLKCFDEGIKHFKFIYEGIFLEILEELGTMPLPPYIHEKLTDNSRYNNVYAKVNGSAACPTAGLHFTEELNEKLSPVKVRDGYRVICELKVTGERIPEPYYEEIEFIVLKVNGRWIISKDISTILSLGF